MLGIVLGVVGLLVALVLLVRLAVAGGDILPRIDTIATTIDSTARAMDDASTTSRGVATTIEQTMPAVEGLAGTVERTQPTLGRMGDSLQAFSILGSRPLADAGAQFSQLSVDLSQLAPQLRALSAGLTPNAATLRTTAESFTRVATDLRSARSTLASGVVQGSIVTVLGATLLLILAVIVWVIVPAIGALVVGVWLLRQFAPEELPRRLRGR